MDHIETLYTQYSIPSFAVLEQLLEGVSDSKKMIDITDAYELALKVNAKTLLSPSVNVFEHVCATALLLKQAGFKNPNTLIIALLHEYLRGFAHFKTVSDASHANIMRKTALRQLRLIVSDQFATAICASTRFVGENFSAHRHRIEQLPIQTAPVVLASRIHELWVLSPSNREHTSKEWEELYPLIYQKLAKTGNRGEALVTMYLEAVNKQRNE